MKKNNPKKDYLKGLTILDFSSRLPGPFATFLLLQMGAKVIKIEDENFQDPFLSEELKVDPIFSSWYQTFNASKEILKIPLRKSAGKIILEGLLPSADGLLMGPFSKWSKDSLLTLDDLKNQKKLKVIVEILASPEGPSSLHDLNALALSGLLDLYLGPHQQSHPDPKSQNKGPQKPPFLPLAGISFAQKIALDFLAALYMAKEEHDQVWTKTYLLDSIQEVLSPFWPHELRKKGKKSFLHNGAFPCYSLYPTKDHNYVALAAIEEKYWMKFCQLFHLPLSPSDRFSQDPQIFETLSQLFLNLDSSQIKDSLIDQDVCLSLVREI